VTGSELDWVLELVSLLEFLWFAMGFEVQQVKEFWELRIHGFTLGLHVRMTSSFFLYAAR